MNPGNDNQRNRIRGQFRAKLRNFESEDGEVNLSVGWLTSLMFGLILSINHFDAHRQWPILGTALLYAIGISLFTSLWNAASKRWPNLLRWPWQRRRDAP